jgi:glycosyltransferase involved in cell wall biosynthesis
VEVHRVLPGNGRLRRFASLPLPFNPFWLVTGILLARRAGVDLIHAHDLPMALIGLGLKACLRKPLIFDIHENYPEALRLWEKKHRFERLVKNPGLARLLQKLSLLFSDSIVVVVKEARDRLMAEGIPAHRIVVVENTVDVESFLSLPVHSNIQNNVDVLLYLGSYSEERGLDVAIRGLKEIRRHAPGIELWIVGKGPNRALLEELAEREGVADKVRFVDWVPFEQCPSYIAAASVCLVPQPSNPFIDVTMPHKLFQYMAMGKPVVVSDARPLQRIVETTGCGEVFRSGSPTSFAQAVLRILRNGQRSRYGVNGYKAVCTLYNWRRSAEQLLSLYSELSKELGR